MRKPGASTHARVTWTLALRIQVITSGVTGIPRPEPGSALPALATSTGLPASPASFRSCSIRSSYSTCGAAAAIVCSDEFANKHNISKPVSIAAQSMITDFRSSFDDRCAMKIVGYDMTAAAAAGVAAALLLALKTALHGWLKRLTWEELRAGLVLAAMTVILHFLEDAGPCYCDETSRGECRRLP